MNEQIRKLAEQAIANVRFWNAEKESYEVDHDELVKFAQLVWEEAYQEGFDAGQDHAQNSDYDHPDFRR